MGSSFLTLPYSHLVKIVDSLNNLSNDEKGFLRKSGDIIVDNEHYFIKELRNERIIFPPDQYIKLYQEYYRKLNSAIEICPSYGMWCVDNKVFEVQPFISSQCIMMRGAVLDWKTLKKSYAKILQDIDLVHRTYGTKDFSPIGIETAIWNFSTDGCLYDFNPVRLYDANCLFTTTNDPDMIEKTKFRNFSPFGMKVNLLATVGIAVKNKDFILQNNPDNWFLELKSILRDNLKAQNSENVDLLENQTDFPKWHPLQIINNFNRGGRNG